MPFDAMVVSKPTTLAELLASVNITPVPMSVLKAHKKAEVRRNPPSFLLTPYPWAMIIASVAGLLMYVSDDGRAIEIISAIFDGIMSACVCFMMASIYSGLTNTTMRGRARWIECTHRQCFDFTVAREIQSVMALVRSIMPNDARLIYGKLYQQNRVLDPYMVVEWNGERACLGIWDGPAIIACATH